MKADRRKALVWSYFFLGLFVVFFLTPPIYMLITSLKTNAEISAATTIAVVGLRRRRSTTTSSC